MNALVGEVTLDAAVAIKIPTKPSLPIEVISRLEVELTPGSVYLEYGCGGSTLFALERASLVVSVENHKPWYEAVRRDKRCQRQPLACFYVNTGLTSKWGYPVHQSKASLRRLFWSRYTTRPWSFLRRHRIIPDVILVDGRFRVACVLRSILELPPAAMTLFILDDYISRKDAYNAIIPFIKDAEYLDRALLFRKATDFNTSILRTTLRRFETDPR